MVAKVWVVVGWFGSDEWIESVHASEESAEVACAEKWKTRHSDHEPEYLRGYQPRGLSKFGIEEHDVLP